MLIRASQIDPTSLNLAIQQATSGAAFSGNVLAYVNAGGFLGNGVVWITGNQDVTGVKRFLDAPRVPYSGGSGAAPSALWVNDQIGAYSGWAANTYVLPQALTASGAALYALIVNMSGALTGQIGAGGGGGSVANVVYQSGDQSITGIKSFVNSPLVPATIGALVGGTEAANYNDLISVSGGLQAQIAAISGGGSAGGAPGAVFQTGNQTISGLKTFTGAVAIGIPTNTGHAVTLGLVLTMSGALTGVSAGGGQTNNYSITGTGTVNINAFASGAQSNTYSTTSGTINVTSSGTVNNTFNAAVNQTTVIGTVTGNFVTMSFWYDEFTLATGLNTIESFVSRDFTFTGYGVGSITALTQGSFSGSFYQRTPTNAKTTFVNFGMPSAQSFTGRGGFNQTISGLNRVGVDIYSIGTGVTGLSLGLFGVGY